MNPWTLACVGLLPPLVAALVMCLRGPLGQRLVAYQLAGALALLVVEAMTFAFAQASSIDLALALGLLTLPAILLFALVAERWL